MSLAACGLYFLKHFRLVFPNHLSDKRCQTLLWLGHCAISPFVDGPAGKRATHHRQALIESIAAVAGGDRDAFRDVYDRTSAKLFGLCLRILGDRTEAEETMQEVYLTVWRRAGSFNAARSSPITWLTVIARSRAIDRLRASARSRAALPIEAAAKVADPADDVSLRLERSDDARQLNTCVDELDPLYAGAIRQAFFGGSTYPELAEQAGVPLGTMKSWIRRSLLKLRECLER
jgi:RNA polymerase sigma factor (sigma-70 family)